jgi:glycine cleavage system aminomethyltransferase T
VQGEAKLSLITSKDGGILDDTIITNAGDYTCVHPPQLSGV